MSAITLLAPPELHRLHQLFVVEESLSVIRHDLRNKLGSIRNAAFYVARKVQRAAPQLGADDPRVPELLALIGTEIAGAEVVYQSRLPPVGEAEDLAAPGILHRLRDLLVPPPGITLVVEATAEPRVHGSADEIALAVFCLIENAVDAIAGRGGTIRLRVAARGDRVALEVEDDGPGFALGARERAFEPMFSTRPGQLGLGLKIARRLAARWRADVELVARDTGACAAIVARSGP